jgi:hypothetical protein
MAQLTKIDKVPYHKHTLTRSYYVTTTPPVLGRACLECGLEQEQRPDKKTGRPVWTTFFSWLNTVSASSEETSSTTMCSSNRTPFVISMVGKNQLALKICDKCGKDCCSDCTPEYCNCEGHVCDA